MPHSFRRPSTTARPVGMDGLVPVIIAVAAAMMLGGSGSLFPLPEIVLQCLLAGLAAVWVGMRPARMRRVPRGAWIVAALMLGVPVCQLLPLPPAIWHHLPGRMVERAALAEVGLDSSWRPLSLTVDRTIAALLAMAAAAAVLIMAAAQDRRGRAILLATIAAIALVSVLVGAGQLSGGDGNGMRFYYPDEAFLDGFQAGHNAEADVLLIGLVMLAAAAADWAGPDWPTAENRTRRDTPRVDPRLLLSSVGCGSLLLALGVVLTASRTGIALLPLAIAAQALLLRRWLAWHKRRLVIAAIAAAALLAVLVALGHHAALGRVWQRFHTSDELRPQIWRDAVFALRQYWPWGSGMGSFIPIFAAAERLEVVTGQYINRAHDDYLEFLIEAGLPGLLAFALIVAQLAKDAWRGWRDRAVSRPQVTGALASLAIITLHSLGDYPLRTMSIACMSAICAGVLLPVVQEAEPGNVNSRDDIQERTAPGAQDITR